MNYSNCIYNVSVLNVCVEDLERFNELKKSANQLAVLCEGGEKLVKGFINILGDIWFAFYSVNVQFKNENNNPYQAQFIVHLLALEEYKRWHLFTQSDELLSVLTTITIGEQLLCYMKNDEQIKKASFNRNWAERKKQIAQDKVEELKMILLEKLEDKAKFQLNINKKIIEIATAEAESANEFGLQKIVKFKEHLSHSLQASSQVETLQQAVVSLSSLHTRKTHCLPLKEQLKLAEVITNNKLIYDIAIMLGRYKQIVKKKMKTVEQHTVERKNITVGNELSRLLPSELASYILPVSRLDFLRRYAESHMVTFDVKGKNRWGRGPIIICMDESSSMHAMKAESKAFCLAFLQIAQKQKRDLAIIPFSSDIGEVQYFQKGLTNNDQVISFSQQFLGGSTNFEKPLRQTLGILSERKFQAADVLFISDGASDLPHSFIEEFNEAKKHRKFECISIILKNNNLGYLTIIKKFSNKVIEVDYLEEFFSL